MKRIEVVMEELVDVSGNSIASVYLLIIPKDLGYLCSGHELDVDRVSPLTTIFCDCIKWCNRP